MKVLFLAPGQSSWIDRDYLLLKSYHQVTLRRIYNFKEQLKVSFDVINHDIVYCWFGSLRYTLPIILAKLLRKPIIIVTGGYDVAKVDEIQYGSFCDSCPSILIVLRKFILSLADSILPVSKSNLNQCVSIAGVKESKCKVAPLFLDIPADILILPYAAKLNHIVTMCNIPNHKVYMCKGIDILIEVAKKLPEFEFKIIGKVESNILPSHLPDNIKLLGYIPCMSLRFIQEIQTSKINLQPSRHESFCSSVVESACLGTYPVGSDKYALAEVISRLGGSTVSGLNPDHFVKVIKGIVEKKFDAENLSQEAREAYPRKTREDILVSLFKTLEVVQ